MKPPQDLYNLWVTSLHDLELWKAQEERLILKLFGNLKNQRVCDIACGIGRLSIKMARSGCEVFGIDLEKKRVRIAKNLSNGRACEFIVADAEHLPYRSNIFDKVVSACALEHISSDEVALSEMRRVLKYGGTLVLTVDSFSYPGTSRKLIEANRKENFVVNYYTSDMLVDKLQRASFKVKSTQYYARSPLSVAIFKVKFALRYLPFVPLLLFPLYPLCQLSDKLSPDHSGYFLAAHAYNVS
jgi:ubiquinone/menaquinone biosynthesis C-methylase UbiE